MRCHHPARRRRGTVKTPSTRLSTDAWPPEPVSADQPIMKKAKSSKSERVSNISGYNECSGKIQYILGPVGILQIRSNRLLAAREAFWDLLRDHCSY